jgi:hypothetical protein
MVAQMARAHLRTSAEIPVAIQPQKPAGQDLIAWQPDPELSASKKTHN